jgi:membrane associated rhomboid family serine protease
MLIYDGFLVFWEFICGIGQGVAHYAHIGGYNGFNYILGKKSI